MYEFSRDVDDVSNVDINLRNELDALKGEFSINILYLRNCKFVRCTCFNDTDKAGLVDCPKCLGSGYFASIEKFNAIESSVSQYSGGDKIKRTAIGAIDQKEEVYFFDYKKLPKQRDMILKVSWDSKGVPVDVISVLEVVNVYEMRGDNGRVETFGVNIHERADLNKKFNDMFHSLPRKAKLVLSKGGKYIWPYKLVQ